MLSHKSQFHLLVEIVITRRESRAPVAVILSSRCTIVTAQEKCKQPFMSQAKASQSMARGFSRFDAIFQSLKTYDAVERFYPKWPP